MAAAWEHEVYLILCRFMPNGKINVIINCFYFCASIAAFFLLGSAAADHIYALITRGLSEVLKGLNNV